MTLEAQAKRRQENSTRLFVFDTHPIQYRSPVFRVLAHRLPNLRVFFFGERFDGNRWWFHEVGKIPKQDWALSLQTGFPNEVIESRKGLWQFFKKISQLLSESKPDAILIYGYYLPEHWILWWCGQSLRIPVIFVGETFSRDGSNFRKWIKQWLQPLFFRGIRQFISIGNKTEEFYRSFEVESERITPARYCIDTDFFQLPKVKSLKTRRDLRAALGIPDDAFVLLFVGRLFERKRPQDVIALHEKLEKDPQIHTILVGNGPMQETLTERVRYDKRIHVVGFKNQAETRDFYHASDLLLVPSEYETWGLVVNEAFAAKLPAMVTDTCGSADDLVISGKTGIVYPKGSIDHAVAGVKWCLEDPVRFARVREQAFEKVTHEYRVDQFADSIIHAVNKTK